MSDEGRIAAPDCRIQAALGPVDARAVNAHAVCDIIDVRLLSAASKICPRLSLRAAYLPPLKSVLSSARPIWLCSIRSVNSSVLLLVRGRIGWQACVSTQKPSSPSRASVWHYPPPHAPSCAAKTCGSRAEQWSLGTDRIKKEPLGDAIPRKPRGMARRRRTAHTRNG